MRYLLAEVTDATVETSFLKNENNDTSDLNGINDGIRSRDLLSDILRRPAFPAKDASLETWVELRKQLRLSIRLLVEDAYDIRSETKELFATDITFSKHPDLFEKMNKTRFFLLRSLPYQVEQLRNMLDQMPEKPPVGLFPDQGSKPTPVEEGSSDGWYLGPPPVFGVPPSSTRPGQLNVQFSMNLPSGLVNWFSNFARSTRDRT